MCLVVNCFHIVNTSTTQSEPTKTYDGTFVIHETMMCSLNVIVQQLQLVKVVVECFILARE